MTFSQPAARQSATRSPVGRAGVTLIELLLVVAILAILATLGLSVIRGAEEDALVSRTQAQIERISRTLNAEIEQYAYRTLPYPIESTNPAIPLEPVEVRLIRDALVEELMRVEFPTRFADLQDPFPVNSTGSFPGAFDWSNPVLGNCQIRDRFIAKLAGGSTDYEGAECLYAILALRTFEDGSSGLSLVRKTEIGDKDGDGLPEIHDAFGEPLLVNLVNADLINDDGSWCDPAVDPHIDPLYNPSILPQDRVGKLMKYRFNIQSVNASGKL